MSTLLIWASCQLRIFSFSGSLYILDVLVIQTFFFNHFSFSTEIKFQFVYTLILFGLISLKFKGRLVGNRHVKVTLHEIFMLHIHIIIHVIQLH